MKGFCTRCGDGLSHEDKFCMFCGTEVKQEYPVEDLDSPKVENKEKIRTMAGKLIGNTSFASSSPGEMVFTQTMPSMNKMLTNVIGPGRYLLAGVIRIFKGLKEAIKDKKKLIPVILMSVMWIALSFLPMLGINTSSIRFLSFLTFAKGGTSAGLLGLIGGTIGKGLFAYFIIQMIIPLFSGKKPFAGMAGGLKTLVGVFSMKDGKNLLPLLVGVGMALILYNFLTGNASLHNSMAGIVAFVLSLRALANKTAFLRGFISSVIHKFNKGFQQDTQVINQLLAGMTTGFALSVLLSTTKINVIGYLSGIFIIVLALILHIVSNHKKGATAS